MKDKVEQEWESQLMKGMELGVGTGNQKIMDSD